MLSVNVTRLISIGLVCMFSTGGCALNRTEVKSLRDPTAARIQFDTPIDTTISALNEIPPHCGPTGNRRVRDEELRVYRIEGTITRVKRKRDHDIHIVLADTTKPEDHVVIESDDANFGKNAASPYRNRLAAARRMLDALISDSSGDRFDDLKGTVVRVTGVGFFDVNHLQKGRSRSCIELHPILTIERMSLTNIRCDLDRIGCRRPRLRFGLPRSLYGRLIGTRSRLMGTRLHWPNDAAIRQ